MFMPMVGGVEFAEDKMEEDVLSKVKNSLADYLKAAEENIKQDKDLLKKKKQDLDIKKKELKDLTLQIKEKSVDEAIPDVLEDHDAVWNLQHNKELDEEPNQTPAGGEGQANETDPTYAAGTNTTYAESAPVKTMNVPLEEMGGSVLVEIHGNERDGFCIRRAGKELPTRFSTIEECETALELFNAHRKERLAAEQTADYIEEK